MECSAGALWSMEDHVNNCEQNNGSRTTKWGKAPMDSIVALIGLQSRGMTMNVK